MAKYGQPDITIDLETSFGLGTNTDITADVDSLNGADIEALTQQSDVFGDTWVEALYVGVKKLEPLVIEGFYDDAGPLLATCNADTGLGEVREVVITWGGAKTTTFDAVISKFNRTPTRNELTRYQLTLSPNGSVVDA